MRNSAPVSGARMLSPEQSEKNFASTLWKVWVVICQPVTERMRPSFISALWQEQLSRLVRFF